MIQSQFNLDHRLSELRPSEAELRVARQLRDASGAPSRPARSIGDTVRAQAVQVPGQPSKLAAI